MTLNEFFLKLPKWNVEAETGYKPITTFWQDFSIADTLGVPSIRDTYERAFKEWHTDYKYLTELVMVLNHKIWQHYYAKNNTLASLYDELWREADIWAGENLKGEEAEYYYRILD